VIDQGGTAYRLGAALNMLRRHITGRIYCVFSPPENCTPDVAGQFGRVAERGCDIAVITRPEVAPQLNFETDHQVLDGFRRPAGAHLIPDRITAIEWALSQAGPGDAVLIAGRGERSICSLAEDRWQLTDDDVCQAWLYGDSSVNQTIVNPVVNPRIFRIDDYRPC
jgi:UDP-N-acetylmuramoyl-L-alanyl-D-glutamate--2,6-diaminopimelate ligase